ncbi:MAG: ROK family glucokinase [Nocardioides sp.]|nr:ROK family glucokinase [Nocardioides sp.]
MALTIGVDVGGTKIAAGVVDERGEVLARARRDSPAADARAIEQTIADLVTGLRAEVRRPVAGVGVGAAGFIDATRSTVLFAPNLAWRDEPLRGELEALLDLPVVVENDGNAAAWGEFVYGAGRDVEDLLLVAVGTGVGGGIVLDGRLHRGASGVAAEIGHLRVVPGGRLCGCGNHGCWEQYASGSALVADTRAAAEADPEGARLLLAGGPVEAIDGPMITAAARAGDPFACARLAELGRWLGEGIASLAAVLDPAAAVIGGGVSAAGDLLLDPLRDAYRANLTGRGHRPELQVRPAALGNDAGMLGAADLARRP